MFQRMHQHCLVNALIDFSLLHFFFERKLFEIKRFIEELLNVNWFLGSIKLVFHLSWTHFLDFSIFGLLVSIRDT